MHSKKNIFMYIYIYPMLQMKKTQTKIQNKENQNFITGNQQRKNQEK